MLVSCALRITRYLWEDINLSVGSLCCPVFEKVAGCTSHFVGGKKRRLLRDPSVFSMSNLRDVVDRLVSGFFYAAPHSPACAQLDRVVSL